MTVFTLARVILDLLMSGKFHDVDNVYFKDSVGNSHHVDSYIVDDNNDLILLEDEWDG